MYKGIDLSLFPLERVTTLSGDDKSFVKARGMFPTEDGVDKEQLQVTRESIYSISDTWEARKITEMITDILRQDDPLIQTEDLLITDATANVGGDSIDFSKHFYKVTSVEYDDLTCGALKNNLKVYRRDNVDPILCKDYLAVLNDIEQDVLFMDPPWGENYRKSEKMMLHLGDNPVWSIVNRLNHKPWIVAIKAPSNFNFHQYRENVQGARKIFSKKLGNHHLVFTIFQPTTGMSQLLHLKQNMAPRELLHKIMDCVDESAEEYNLTPHEVVSILDSTSYRGISHMIRDLWVENQA